MKKDIFASIDPKDKLIIMLDSKGDYWERILYRVAEADHFYTGSSLRLCEHGCQISKLPTVGPKLFIYA